MLKTRVITAVVLLAVLLLILYFNSYVAFTIALAVFFSAGAWENLRLFGAKFPILGAVTWTAVFLLGSFAEYLLPFVPAISFQPMVLFGASTFIWIGLTALLVFGLPGRETSGNRLVAGLYGTSILACFLAMSALFKHSSVYLVSVLAVIWIADIGAYFSGKAFGKRKLAPTISPGKSWEGVVGGLLAVLLIAALSTRFPQDTFSSRLLASWGWIGFLLTLSLMVAASVIGDLFESMLKRRAGMKDSSGLLPGHGGVLDRIDALIPTLPLAILIDYLM